MNITMKFATLAAAESFLQAQGLKLVSDSCDWTNAKGYAAGRGERIPRRDQSQCQARQSGRQAGLMPVAESTGALSASIPHLAGACASVGGYKGRAEDTERNAGIASPGSDDGWG